MVFDRLRQWSHRVIEQRGYERETVVIILKCVIAATLAFGVGNLLVPSQQIGFAPFSALLVVRPSVYGSVLQSSRYVAAVVLGALLAGLAGTTLGADLWIFALVVLVALVLGYARVFGSQGTQIPVVAAFALAGGTADSLSSLGELLVMVCIGSVSALLTNLVLAPAIRFRDAENAVLEFADSLRQLTQEMADGCREGNSGLDDVGYWKQRANGFDNTVRNANATVDRQEERVRLNPRRLVGRPPPRGAANAYRNWIVVLERYTQHTQSTIRTLYSVTGADARYPAPTDGFLRGFAPVLDNAAEALRIIRDAEELERRTASLGLRTCLEQGFQQLDRVREEFDEHGDRDRDRDWDRWPVCSGLLNDLDRMFEELWEGHENSTRAEST